MKQFTENGYWLALVSLLGFIGIIILGILGEDISSDLVATTCVSGVAFCVVTVARIISHK